MTEEYAIEVDNLWISYKSIQSYSIKKMFLKGKRAEKEDFDAVKGVSFRIKKGEIVGLVGKNGCGKSTTLNAIAGIFSPNKGSIDLKGQSVSLLSIGVGFQREMSGRDNIYLSGMLLGFSEEEIREKEQAIIDFAELGNFIDKPVKTYSSGMYSKLAFAITSTLETDIILIDEVLSVGDQRFKKKSYARMKELISKQNRTVIIVSHSLSTLEELCEQVIWMNEGEIVEMGEPKSVLSKYTEFMEGKK